LDGWIEVAKWPGIPRFLPGKKCDESGDGRKIGSLMENPRGMAQR